MSDYPLTWILAIDWDGDGALETLEEARLTGVNIRRGRPRQFDRSGYQQMQVGKCTLTLDNYDGRYDPWNTSSALYPNVKPGRAVSLIVMDASNYGYQVFSGLISSIKTSGSRAGRCTIVVEDGWRWLKDRAALVITQTDIATGDAIDDVVGAANWPSGQWVLGINMLGYTTVLASDTPGVWGWGRTVSTGRTVIPYWWGSGNAFSQVMDLVEAESGFAYVANTGHFVFHDRDDIYAATADTTITQDEIKQDVDIGQPADLVRNYIEVDVDVRTAAATADVWTWPGSAFKIRAGDSVTVYCNFDNPVDNAVNPVATTDYTFNSESDGSGTNLTSSLTVTMTAYGENAKLVLTSAAAQEGWVTLLKIRGDALESTGVTPLIAEDSTSQGLYSPNALIIDNPWMQDYEDGRDYADWLLSWLKDPKPAPRIKMEGRPDLQFGYDLGDHFQLTLAYFGIDDLYRIGYISHQSKGNMQRIITEYHLERLDTQNYWLLGTSGFSELGQTTYLGY